MDNHKHKCVDCGKKKPEGEYYFRYGNYREKHCKACSAVRRRERIERKKNDPRDESARKCSRCGKLLPAEEFHLINGYRLRHCKGCENITRRARMARKRKEKTKTDAGKPSLPRKTDAGKAERVARLRCRLALDRVLGLALLLKRWDVQSETFRGLRKWNAGKGKARTKKG